MPDPRFTSQRHGVPMLRELGHSLDRIGMGRERIHFDSFGV